MKSQLIGKAPDAGKDWEQEKGTTRIRWLDGITVSMDMSLSKHRDSEGQGSLASCYLWGPEELLHVTWFSNCKTATKTCLMYHFFILPMDLMLGNIESRGRRGWQRMRELVTSLTRWTWVRVSSKSWWWTGKPGVQQSMGSQRVGHDWVTELNWTECITLTFKYIVLCMSTTIHYILNPQNKC